MKTLKFSILICCLLITSVSIAQTSIGGGVFSNTTYTKANSPYTVTSDLVVFPNVTLTIEPGVELRVNNGVKIEIRGHLLSNGTDSNRIIYTSSSNTPFKGIWQGIDIKNSLGASANFVYSTFEYAFTASKVECCFQGGPIYYNHCKFFNNDRAMREYTGFDILVENSEFDNNNYGISEADKVIRNCTFTNHIVAIFYTERIDIDSSTFQFNQTAIQGGRGLLSNSIITDNGVGVRNTWEGFEIRNNVISNNDTGIIVREYNGTYMPIKQNRICNNTGFNVKNWGSMNKDLTDNCWCLSDSALIEQKLKDGYDDLSLGLFNFSIYDTSCQVITSENIKDLTIGIADRVSEPDFSIYPNPAKDFIFVNSTGTSLQLSVYTYHGKKLLETKFSNNKRIDLSEFPSGIYFMQISNGNFSKTEKIIKQ